VRAGHAPEMVFSIRVIKATDVADRLLIAP
jgi:hypothetical protein